MVTGYKLDRDDEGLTAQERTVLEQILAGKKMTEIQESLGVVKQRVYAIRQSLRDKGKLPQKGEVK